MDNRHAELIERMRAAGLHAEAEALEGVVRRAQLDWKEGLIPGPPKGDLASTTGLNKMKPDEIPDWVGGYMDTSLKTPKMKRRIQKPGFYVHPSIGGEGKELPSGVHGVSFNPPPRKQGEPYSQNMEDYTLDVLTQDQYVPEWDEIADFDFVVKDYLEQAEAERENLSKTSTEWDRRMADWPARAKQNFWVNVDWFIGDPGGLFNPQGSSLLAAIENRRQEIARIQSDPSGLPAPTEAATQGRREVTAAGYEAPLGEMQERAIAFLSEQDNFDRNPEYYLQVLSLLYGGKMERIVENPLGVGVNSGDGIYKYPRELTEFLLRYNNANPPTSRETKPAPTIDEMIERPWESPGTTPDDIGVATWSKKHSADSPMYGGFMTGPNFDLPMPDAREFHKTDYDEELALLDEIEAKAKQILSIAAKAPDRSMAGVQSIATEMDRAIRDFLGTVIQMYGSSNFVTKSGRMNLTYGIGRGSKMEIFLKAMLLGQAWQAYLKNVGLGGEAPPPGGVDMGKMVSEAPGGDAPGQGLPASEAAEAREWLRLAGVFDAQGRFDWSDACEAMAREAQFGPSDTPGPGWYEPPDDVEGYSPTDEDIFDHMQGSGSDAFDRLEKAVVNSGLLPDTLLEDPGVEEIVHDALVACDYDVDRAEEWLKPALQEALGTMTEFYRDRVEGPFDPRGEPEYHEE